ncbi:MAG: type I DNA topoisomerase [bacterium]|nr:type I DNA topoisomerase [bacterium]
MGKKLIIVESGAKATTIENILGEDYRVMSCKGHVKDLPKSKIGIDVESGFEPTYTSTDDQKKTLTALKKAAKGAELVYLATDPDREGEAISKHLLDELVDGHQIQRITFNEITASAIKAAVKDPRELDMDLVYAQTARRVLDRLVGYQISPILWKKVARGLSAGRVQSVAVRLVVEREEEIEAFVPVEYWTLDAIFSGEAKVEFPARLVAIEGDDGKLQKVRGENNKKKYDHIVSTVEEAEKIRDDIREQAYAITGIQRKDRKRSPRPSFITSSLQAMANRRFGYSGRRTMVIAQQLYEGIDLNGERAGLITYMRTDSTRVASSAVNAARDHIQKDFGNAYLPDKPRFFKSRKGAQDAHEAIRPTSVGRTPKAIKKFLTADQYKLYDLIYRRFVASQMTEALFETTGVDIEGGAYRFRANGSVMKFDGYLRLFPEDIEDDVILPELRDDEKLELEEITPNQHFTKPPPRYNDASLVKELEKLGIGRPSTYAPIVSTIINRKYIERVSRAFYPTELGRFVNAMLVSAFPDILNVGFTARIEDELDRVEEGEMQWRDVLAEFYKPFEDDLATAEEKMDAVRDDAREETDVECDECGAMMIVKWGRFGKYLACEKAPECKNTKNFVRNEDGEVVIEEEPETDEVCENCGKPMTIKTGRYGKFLACTGYPDCKTTKPILKKVDAKCPLCGGQIIERKAGKGKMKGRTFYGCANYPECTFAAPDVPVPEPCPECDYKYLLKRKSGLYCHNKDCGHGKKRKPGKKKAGK